MPGSTVKLLPLELQTVKPIIIGYTSQHALSNINMEIVVLTNDRKHFARPDLKYTMVLPHV